ncbi:hypothetical protein HanIR_Chr10g0457661 [Helianthus annuus]|nr:hypothetical protein HanIR_Chr10g0457661 [Helianthus annuus]
MNPLSSSSCSCVDSSCISDGANRYGDLATCAAPRTKSIRNSTCRYGGSPGKSSGKTSGNSFIIGISSSLRSSAFLSTTCARKAMQPFLRLFRTYMGKSSGKTPYPSRPLSLKN